MARHYNGKMQKNLLIAIAGMLLLAGGMGYSLHLKKLESAPAGTSSARTAGDISAVIREEMGKCYRTGENSCYRTASALFLSQFAPEDILADFEKDQNYPEIFSRCHEVTHYVGRKIYEN